MTELHARKVASKIFARIARPMRHLRRLSLVPLLNPMFVRRVASGSLFFMVLLGCSKGFASDITPVGLFPGFICLNVPGTDTHFNASACPDAITVPANTPLTLTGIFSSFFDFGFTVGGVGGVSGDIGQAISGSPLGQCNNHLHLNNSNPPLVQFTTSFQPGGHLLEFTLESCDLRFVEETYSLTITAVPSATPTPTPPPPPALIDPVASGMVTNNAILNDPSVLGRIGTTVTGIASDGVTRIVMQIPAYHAGEAVSIALLNDHGAPSSSSQDDGALLTAGDATEESSVQVTAVNSPQGIPMAFAIYRAPLNFARKPMFDQDSAAVSRLVSLQVLFPDMATGSKTNLNILRPPVVLVHGLWGDPSNWEDFQPLVQSYSPQTGVVSDPRFTVTASNYNFVPPGTVTATVPAYSQAVVRKLSTADFGLAYNTQFVYADILAALKQFSQKNHAAAVQVDVVAHSMGGDIVRTIPFSVNGFRDNTYGFGKIDKLITIGTPHLGSPLAVDLLDNANTCFRNELAGHAQQPSLLQVTLNGQTIDGGVGDLEGDHSGNDQSDAIRNLQNGQPIFPLGLIAGSANADNFSKVGATAVARLLRIRCHGDPLAHNLTSARYPTLFNGASDTVVSVRSQLNGQVQGALLAPGVIHLSGLTLLGFQRPGELDPDAATSIPSKVIKLLNESPGSCDFQQSVQDSCDGGN